MRTIYSVMCNIIAEKLENVQHHLLDISRTETIDKESGAVHKFTRYECEVPRKQGEFSRCRFTVKVEEKEPELEVLTDNDDFLAKFKNLSLTYIDAKGSVYFKADKAILEKELEFE